MNTHLSNRRKWLVSFLFFAFIIVPNLTFAQVNDTQNLTKAITQKIAELQTQLASLQRETSGNLRDSERIRTSVTLNVRSVPSTGSSVITRVLVGSIGTIRCDLAPSACPSSANGYVWRYIQWDAPAVAGWSVEGNSEAQFFATLSAVSSANTPANNLILKTIGPVDTTPPVLSGITASFLTSNSATISWTSNEQANTQVDYGTTTAYGSSTTLNSALTTSHTKTVSGLTANTLYHYRVKSRDSAGNTSTSNDFTFTTSATINGRSCTDLTKTHLDAPCSFNFTKFRDTDPRLNAIEAKGIGGSGFFNGQQHLVRNLAELNAAKGNLRPGDQLVLADGEWRDVVINIQANGTLANPIIVRPQTLGGVTLTGTSQAAFSGSHLVVYGLIFQKGNVVSNGSRVLALGTSESNSCDFCIADRIKIDGFNSAPAEYDTLTVFYLLLIGRDITVANSEFLNKRNIGTMLSAYPPAVNGTCPQLVSSSGECFLRLLFLNNRVSGFSGNPLMPPDKNHKVLQLGHSTVVTRASFSVFEGNTFENAGSENSLFTMKMSDVIIRRNTFRSNEGTLNLRMVNRVLIENNTFDANGRDSMGGVRVEGQGHWIINNVFRGLVKPMNDYYWPIAIHTGLYEDAFDAPTIGTEPDHARAKDLVIADNIFQDVMPPAISMGIFPSAALGRALLPKNIFVLDNLFSFSGPRPSTSCAITATDGPFCFIGGNRAQFTNLVERENRFVDGIPPPPPPLSSVLPNLQASLSSVPASVAVGTTMTFSGSITNIGTLITTTFNNRFRIDDSIGIPPAPKITSLGTGASSSMTSGPWTATEGFHSIRLCADEPTPTITESNETDNCAYRSFTVTVTPPLPPPPPATKLIIGDRVQTVANLNVRAAPSIGGSLLLGTQPTGAMGIIIGGPIRDDSYNWWKVNFDSGADGWSVENFLVKAATVSPPPALGAPTIGLLSRTSGPFDTAVIITGTRFTSTGNNIKLGGIYVGESLTSSNGTTITFIVPDGGSPCLGCFSFAKLLPGTYALTVENRNGTSNAVNFTVQ